MNRRDVFRALVGFVMASLLYFGGMTRTEAAQKAAPDKYPRCAKACNDCFKACRACSQHCASMIAAGMKQHVKSKSLSDDCADICAAAAKITSRHGPLSAAICEACAKACDACGAECGKSPDMKPMKVCAQSCAVCAKACREMFKP